MDDQEMSLYKVIRISHVWALSKKDAVKHCQEDIGGRLITVEFAAKQLPKGFWAATIKQIIG